MTVSRPTQPFPVDYDDARARFRDAANLFARGQTGARIESFRVPSATETDLTVDSLYVPPFDECERLLIVTSGVHGIEGFTGSAIQLEFLERLAPRLDRRRIGLYVVHALNPYGFKRLRRATESNVNLNRNLSLDPSLFKSENSAYERLAPLLEPTGRLRAPRFGIARTATLIADALLRKGFTADSLLRGLALGQYRFPRGLEFGGHGPEPQVEHYIGTLERITPGYRDVTLIDLHTGLGDRGRLHLIPGDTPTMADPALLEELFRPLLSNPHFTYSPSTADGFYETLGDMNRVLSSVLAPEQRSLSVTFEFGTLGSEGWRQIGNLHRLITENQGFHHGFASADAERMVRESFTELFFPSDLGWRRRVLEKARLVLSTVVDRL